MPAVRLVIEAPVLQPLSTPYTFRGWRTLGVPPRRKPVIGYEHPLSVYADLFCADVAWASEAPDNGQVSP